MVYIYTLSDSIGVRYVGKTKNKNSRLRMHIFEAKRSFSHKSNWINKLLSNGLKPILEIIDEVPETDWEFWEKYWISQFKVWGFRLVNGTEGGENPPILTGHTVETKMKLSIIKKNFFKENKHHRLGVTHTEEHKAKILKTKKENPIIFTDEIRRNMSVSHLLDGSKPCVEYLSDGTIKNWETVSEAIKFYSNTHILCACKGKRKTASGSKWGFIEN